MAETLTAPHVLEFAYTRSTGPIIGAFLTGLRAGKILGIRGSDGRVLVPPQEYDPVTSDDLTELVEVSAEGEVVTWSWNPTPKLGQPLDRPFAWALVRLDGADTPMLHALDVASADHVQTGLRVRVRWATERVGAITDIACFEPAVGDADAIVSGDDAEPVTVVTSPVRLDLTYTPGVALQPFLRGTQERRMLGRRCSQCAKVYMPPRGVCSMCGAAFTDEQVECGPKGTVATFLIVNVNFASREVDLPYVAAEVLFDNSHTTGQFLLLGTPHDQVRLGMRVEAVWSDADELEPTLSNVTHVVAIDEPDVSTDEIVEYM